MSIRRLDLGGGKLLKRYGHSNVAFFMSTLLAVLQRLGIVLYGPLHRQKIWRVCNGACIRTYILRSYFYIIGIILSGARGKVRIAGRF